MDTTLARQPIGQVLDGRYRVESLVARGGMATVYLGTDTRLDRTVALKIMHAELANDEDFVRRFVSEARSIARLSHPNVVGVYDQGADGRTLFLAMEYVPGRTLRDLLSERGRLDAREALDIMYGVLSGLAAAHAAGLVHRDIKPENVLLGSGNSVKVADFGLARMLSGTSHTKTGMLIGTAAYLAPEQVSRGVADARTDVYAAGVMLFELLTGMQPHTADTPLAVAYKHVNEIVPAPSRVVPGVPPALDALVALATSRDPELRPSDAGQFLHAVTSARTSMPGAPGSPYQMPPSGNYGQYAAPYGAPPAPPVPAQSPMAPFPGPAAPGNAGPGPSGPGYAGPGPSGPGYAGPGPLDDLIPGMSGPGGSAMRGPARGAEPVATTQLARDDFYRTSANHTMVVAPEQAAGYGPGHGRPRGPSGPGLQGWLFSRKLVYLIAGLAAVVLISVGIWWQTAGKYATIPPVGGMAAATASLEIHNEGLTARDGGVQFSNTVAKGSVVGTSPAIGSRISKGSVVTLIISEGPHLVPVPQVGGSTLPEAEAALRHAGLIVGNVQKQASASVQSGIVIGTTPAGNTTWPQNRPVGITVSSGQPVPNFVGQQKSAAEQWAQQNGVNLTETPDGSSNQQAGVVISQSIPAGSSFSGGESMTIKFSTGPQQVNVPDVRGMNVGDAKQELMSAGFQVNVMRLGPSDNVFSENPTGQAPAGSSITIWVGF